MKRKFTVLQKKAFQMLIAGLLCFCVSCSGDSNQVDLKLIPVLSGEKWGYINRKGEYVINPQFQDAGFFREGLARVVSSDGKIGFINSDGKYEISAQYKSATYFSNGLAFVVSEGSYPVCIDKLGETQFSLKQVQRVFSFHEGLALIIPAEENYGYVNKAGETVINPQFDLVSHFSEGLAKIQQKNKNGFIDKSGKIIINPQFDHVSDFHNGRAAFSNGNQKGYIGTKGNYIINPQFDDAGDFREGMAVIRSGREWGYINEDGKIEINPQFDDAEPFQSGLAAIKQSNKWGYINKKGKLEINPQFDKVSSFFDDIAFVEINDKWGIIDKKGKYIVNPQFDHIKTVVGEFEAESDYYDATAFLSTFFGENAVWNYKKFTNNTTLQNLVNNETFGDCLNATSELVVTCNTSFKVTDEISITKTQFVFTDAVYSYYNYKKQYNFNEEVDGIGYKFSLRGDAYEKTESIVSSLVKEIETRYNIKLEQRQYIVSGDCEKENIHFGIYSPTNGTIILSIESLNNRDGITYSSDGVRREYEENVN
jgi:predicted DNA-binding WGR domain protein